MNAETETAAWAETFKLMIERAGAELVGVENGEILFRSGPHEPICRLYPFAIRSALDVQLAVKAEREKQKSAMWELTNPAAKQSAT